jgi:hypothetical protein
MSGIYEIAVRGTLSIALTEAVGFDFVSVADGLTNLVGHNVDQARLHGVFALLRDLHIELVSVNELPVELPDRAQAR